MGMSDAEKAKIRAEIFDFLGTNGDMTRKEIVEKLNPPCSASKVDSDLAAWRLANGIPTRKTRAVFDAVTPTIHNAEPIKPGNDRTGEQVAFIPEDKPAPQVDTPPSDPVKPSPAASGEMHNFSCAGKVPVDVYQKFKVIAAYRNESARSLIGEWMADYVERHKGVFREISALAD